MRRALLVGIDDYKLAPLSGCRRDAETMAHLLAKNEEDSLNFACKTLTAPPKAIDEAGLRKSLKELLTDKADVALFYFSGHGAADNLGGFLVTPDCSSYDEGVAMSEVLTRANMAPIDEVIIILDCCNSGALGSIPTLELDQAILRQGVSILTASREAQPALEVGGAGVFTSLLRTALEGGAADLRGNVTVASLYAYVDQALGAWSQRPLFKSHVSQFSPLRKCTPAVKDELLLLLPVYFSRPEAEHSLDPSYEPDLPPKNEVNEEIFGNLQSFRAARLVEPVGEEHMYYAAKNSRSCRLTRLGAFYWQLAAKGRI